EFRSQNSGVRMQSVGDSDLPLIEDHQIFLFCGGAKTPFIHPPVAQNTQVNSGDWHLYSV
ncbi:hypothetical protein, partial [Nostoc sp. S13]|uniref:hypothetical protein n=1 Tax=Nostoc sp. S13 TaxID=3019266 RepID=UPI002637FFBE